MISRVAESCFWLSRYLERAESYSQLLNVHLSTYLDAGLEDIDEWRPLVIVSGGEELFLEKHGSEAIEDSETVLAFLTWEPENPSSVLSSVRYARENARTTRETISLEMWEILNGLWLWLCSPEAQRIYDTQRHEFYKHVRNQCVLLQGVRAGTMLHETAFDFMRLGTAMERAGMTARILDVKYHSLGPGELGRETPLEAAQWLATLRSCSAVEPFFKRSANELGGAAVASFLLFDRAFPRSVLHNIHMADHVLDLIRPSGIASVGEKSANAIAELLEWIEALTIERVMSEGMHEALTWVVDSTAAAAGVIHQEFFDPPPTVAATAPGA